MSETTVDRALAGIELATILATIRSEYELELKGRCPPCAWYDREQNTLIVRATIEYKIPQQCPGKKVLVLYEEHSDDHTKPIVGFKIENVRELCAWYDVPLTGNTLKISDVLTILSKEVAGICSKTAVHMAHELLLKHHLDEVNFS